jgi:hypothetical protein
MNGTWKHYCWIKCKRKNWHFNVIVEQSYSSLESAWNCEVTNQDAASSKSWTGGEPGDWDNVIVEQSEVALNFKQLSRFLQSLWMGDRQGYCDGRLMNSWSLPAWSWTVLGGYMLEEGVYICVELWERERNLDWIKCRWSERQKG